MGGEGGARIPAQPHTFQNLLLRDTYAVLTRCLRKKITKTYEKKYQRAGDIAVNQGKDFHDDNYYEEKAERYGRKMAAIHMRKIK